MTSCSQVAITMGLARVVSTANFLGEDVFINLLKLSRNLVTNSTACTQAASMGLLEQPSLRTGKGNAVPGPDFLGVRTQLPAARTNHSRTQSTGTPTRSLSSLSHPIPFPSTEMCVCGHQILPSATSVDTALFGKKETKTRGNLSSRLCQCVGRDLGF